MKCPKCGFTLPEDSEFCQYCGARVIRTSEISPADLQVEKAVAAPSEISLLEELPVNAAADVPAQQESVEASTEGSAVSPVLVVPEVDHDEEAPLEAAPPVGKEGKTPQYCTRCGGLIDPVTKKCPGCGKRHFFAGEPIPILFLSLALVAAIGLNIAQFVIGQDRSKKAAELGQTVSAQEAIIDKQKITISEREATISEQGATIRGQEATISKQKNTIEDLESARQIYKERADEFSLICRELQTGNLGYASNNFHADESVIVVSKSQENRKFTLTAYWKNGGTVRLDFSGSSADVDFDKNSWTTSTPVTIDPRWEGVTVVTFSNNVNSERFKVIIIVT